MFPSFSRTQALKAKLFLVLEARKTRSLRTVYRPTYENTARQIHTVIKRYGLTSNDGVHSEAHTSRSIWLRPALVPIPGQQRSPCRGPPSSPPLRPIIFPSFPFAISQRDSRPLDLISSTVFGTVLLPHSLLSLLLPSALIKTGRLYSPGSLGPVAFSDAPRPSGNTSRESWYVPSPHLPLPFPFPSAIE